MKKAIIFWCAGLSGVGKTTLANLEKKQLETSGLAVMIVDGDMVRGSDKEKLGFRRSDIEKNNLRIVEICEAERGNFEVIIVSVISPLDNVRKIARERLEPLFYLIYISCDIDSLKKRDPKGLYEKADKGEITDLIGYSANNPYEIPTDADFTLDTSSLVPLDESVEALSRFIRSKVLEAGVIQ